MISARSGTDDKTGSARYDKQLPEPALAFALPLAAPVAEEKADSPKQPVNSHSHPYAEELHMKVNSQKIAESYPEDPHRNNRNQHGYSHIV